MGSVRRNFSLSAILFVGLIGMVTGSSFISGHVFGAHGSGGRSLLQAKTNCPVSFEFANYTVITSQCKGPKYPAKECCAAFKEFACPYADQINNQSNDCATTMFSYINLNGHYPPGLFASECREGKEGLACPASSPQSGNDSSAAGHINQSLISLIVLIYATTLALLFS